MALQEPECESLECEHCFREEALSIIQDALQEMNETWGEECFDNPDGWTNRAAALLAKYKVKN